MIYLLVVGATLLSAALAAVNGCDPSSITGSGFDVSFYKYPHFGTAFKTDSDYYSTGFKQYGYLSSVSGVTAINYASTSSTGGVTTGSVYGYTLTNSNFTMSLGGYFMASQTGDHTFTMYADDGAYLQFGAGKSCCGNALDDVSDSSFKAEWPYTKTATFSLVKGVYYPIKIVFVNWDGDGGLNVKYTAPDSSVVTEIGSQVYQIQQEYCTTTSTWTGSVTSTITRSA
ncbi:hypothetical protein OXX80_014013, partial [Metschnikowia pulcherrima]